MPRSSLLGTVALLLLLGCSPATTVAELPATTGTATTASAEVEEAEEDGAQAVAEEESSDASHDEWGPLYDVVSIADGDTIAVSVDGVRERVRVIGINAPEMARSGNAAECYAQPAASRVQSLVQGGRVHLLPDPTQDDRDRYDRLLRHVVMEGGGHLALLLVEEGFAVERQYAAPYQYQADLLAAQERARAAGLGLWSACEAGAPPAAPPAPAQPASPPVDPSDCTIKGNVSSSGELIYHVPGQRHYDETVISPEKGERWFCSEQEAVDAGWRKAKV